MSDPKKKPFVVLCDDGWKCAACPEIYVQDDVAPEKQISITDDFGQTVSMSKDQFRVLVSKSKKGELDNI